MATIVATTYTIQPGDTLGGIAQKLGVSLSALIAANRTTLATRQREECTKKALSMCPKLPAFSIDETNFNPDLIFAGTVLSVPASAPPPTPTPGPVVPTGDPRAAKVKKVAVGAGVVGLLYWLLG